jgi:hypothetical protein
MRISSYLVFLFSVLFFNTAQAQESNFQVNIGDAQIQVQAPNGFYEVTKTFPGAAYLAETITPPSNRLLAMLMTEEDVENLRNKQEPQMQSYVLIQTLKAWEGLTISEKMFAEGKSQLKAQQDTILQQSEKDVSKLINNAVEKMSEDTGRNLDVKLGEQKMLGFFFESDDALGFNTLSHIQSSNDQGTYNDVIALSSMLLRVKGKIMYVYVYKKYTDQKDIDWINKTAQEIVQNIINNNQVSEKEEASYGDDSSGFNMDELLKRTGIGAFIGLLIGLAMGLGKKKK